MAFIDPGQQYTPDERGTAQRIADEWGHELAWCEEMNKWLVREEGAHTWKIDWYLTKTTKAMETCERQRLDSGLAGMTRPANMKNALELAKPLVAVMLSDFDKQPLALNTPEGLIDLRSCEYIDPGGIYGRYMKSTRVSPDPEMGTPLWNAHLHKMCHGNVEIIAFLKRLAGLTLIGDQNLKPHISPQLNGLGRNGKGVFLQAIGWALGDYAQFASTRLLTTTENAHTTEQAGLRGMRLVVVEEVKRINSSLLKDLTGGGVLRARRMRMDDEEFLKSWTLWFNNNGPLLFSGDTSDGLWQRVPRIDLGSGIPVEERIDDMAERLKEEAPGVLQWCLDGLIEFRAVGLCAPEKVKHDTNLSRISADSLAMFIQEHYEFDENSKVVASDFMRRYNDWIKLTGELSSGGRRAVYDELRTRFGLNIEFGSKGKYWVNGLKPQPEMFGQLSSMYGGLGSEDEDNPKWN